MAGIGGSPWQLSGQDAGELRNRWEAVDSFARGLLSPELTLAPYRLRLMPQCLSPCLTLAVFRPCVQDTGTQRAEEAARAV